ADPAFPRPGDRAARRLSRRRAQGDAQRARRRGDATRDRRLPRAAGVDDARAGAARRGRTCLSGRRGAPRRRRRRRRVGPPGRRRALGARPVPGVDRVPARPARADADLMRERTEQEQNEAVFWGKRPLGWIAFALAVLAVPAFGLLRETGRSFIDLLPTVNATLNGTS